MATHGEPTTPRRGACPNCGSKNLRRIREGDNETVVVQRRACRDCGMVFSPAVSPLLVLVTLPLALAFFGFAVWGAFFNERLDPPTVNAVAGVAGLIGLCLVGATVQILRQREPKIHESPRGPREAKPWDNPQGEG
jgi:hypothetical protein